MERRSIQLLSNDSAERTVWARKKKRVISFFQDEEIQGVIVKALDILK